jgi:SH3-like domain-containing protein
LGEAAEAVAEWAEIVTPVDMHARPQQSSETVKVAEKGLKLRVTARDKNWVQVSDPATSANGWIYSRFLKPTAPPAQ